MKFLYFFICLFCIFQSNISMEPENPDTEQSDAPAIEYFKSIQNLIPRIGKVSINTEELESEPPLPHDARADLSKNAAAQKLLKIIHEKQTLLGVNIDSESLEIILKLLPFIANNICLVKICVERYADFSFEKLVRLKELSILHNFMILNDSKLADNAVETITARYTKGFYKIASWADFLTVHFVEGMDILDHLQRAVSESNIKEHRGAFVIAQTVRLLTPHYTESVVHSVKHYPNDFIAGIIHVTDMSAANKGLIKIAAEEIPLNKDVQQIQNCLVEAIKNRKTDICFLRFSPSESKYIEQIPQLQNFCWEKHKKLNS